MNIWVWRAFGLQSRFCAIFLGEMASSQSGITSLASGLKFNCHELYQLYQHFKLWQKPLGHMVIKKPVIYLVKSGTGFLFRYSILFLNKLKFRNFSCQKN